MKRKHEEPTRYARIYTQLLVFVAKDVASMVLGYAKEPDKKLVRTITTKKDVVFLVDQGTSLKVVDDDLVSTQTQGLEYITCTLAMPPLIVHGTNKSHVLVCDGKSSKRLKRMVAYDESFEITALAPLGDRVLAAVWDYRPWLAIFDIHKGKRLSLQKTTCDYPITALASFDKDTFAAGCKDGAIEMWDAMMHWQVGKHAECVTALAALPDGRLVSGSLDHTVCVWEPHTKDCVHILKFQAEIDALQLLPCGRLAIACRHSVQMWDLDTFLQDGMLRRHDGWQFGDYKMFSKPITKPDADVSKDPATLKRLFDGTFKLIAVTAPWTPQTMQRAKRTAKTYRNANPGDTVITVRGANPFNNKAPGVEDMPFCFPLKTHSSPSNWALIHLIAKMLGISFGAKGGMNFAWLLKQHGKYGNIMALIPEYQRETTAAKAAQGLIDIFAATTAEFPKHCEPGRPEFDLATAEELAIIHEFIQARVRALFRKLGLNEPTYAEFMELMSFDSGFWADLFKDEPGKFSQEIKSQITDGWLKFVCRCCALAPMVTLPLATDPLEMLPVPMLAWLLKHGLISEDFFNQGVEAALGAGISSQLFAKIVASFPDGAIANFLRDYGKIILLAIVDDEGDDFFFLSLVNSRSVYPFTVVHMAAPNIVYGENPKVLALNMKAFWGKLLPAFPHEIEFCPDSIGNADKVFGLVNSFIHAAEEKGDDLETKRAATAARVKRARDCTVTGFKDFNAKKQRTAEDYQDAVATSWGLFDAK